MVLVASPETSILLDPEPEPDVKASLTLLVSSDNDPSSLSTICSSAFTLPDLQHNKINTGQSGNLTTSLGRRMMKTLLVLFYTRGFPKFASQICQI